MALPLIYPVRQTFDQPKVADLEREVSNQITASRLTRRVRPGGRIAVAVGSRGIANLLQIVRATVNTLKGMKYDPFLVAAMGTHGGGTAEGQRQVLADFGITEATVGVPIKTDMESVKIGVNELGADVYWDKNALSADGVLAVNRIKAHTDFVGPIESGIIKMIVIGLGKRESPEQVHRMGGLGMAKMVPASARVVLSNTPFVLGLAILENAAEETARLLALEPEELFDREPELLLQAKAWMARLPFDEADVLIVGELGKNYSGTGMDTNVLGRRLVEGEPDFPTPRIRRIAVLDVAPESHGNAVGVGLADLTTQRLVDAIDHESMRLNTLTSRFLLRAKIPLTFRTDREVIETCLDQSWQPDHSRARLALIPNTLELTTVYATKPLLDELNTQGRTIAIGDPIEVPFIADDRLDLVRLFPHSLIARRQLHQPA